MPTARDLRVCAFVVIATQAVVATAVATAAAQVFIDRHLFGLASISGARGLCDADDSDGGPAANSLLTLQR